MKSTKKDVSYMLEVAITNLSAEDIKGIEIKMAILLRFIMAILTLHVIAN